MAKSGKPGCANTPHEQVGKLWQQLDLIEDRDELREKSEALKQSEEFKAAAKLELEFLESLLPK